MAFANNTYEKILNRMLTSVSNKYPNLDVREGSILFNALAPAAMELAIAYVELEGVLNSSFVLTAPRFYLLMACDQMGMDISVFDAHAGTFKGEFNVEVPIGSRWNCDLYNFIITKQLGLNETTGYYEYEMDCEETGTGANSVTGELSAITDLPQNLTHAKLIECLIEGENESTDTQIREAYIEFVTSAVSDGNVAQYERWCSEYEGIGNSKIFPLWDGDNTVKVSILSVSNKAASETLIEEFQNYLDPNIEGMGNGVAPIGAFVTVTTATEVPINITANVKLSKGYSELNMPDIERKLEEFFSSIAYEKTLVSFMSVGAAILDVPGVEFVSNLMLNGKGEDVVLGDEEVPVIGTTNWTVVV